MLFLTRTLFTNSKPDRRASASLFVLVLASITSIASACPICDQADSNSDHNHATHDHQSFSTQSPFSWLEVIPNTVDAAVVFNNPADQFLLQDSGRAIRMMMAITGLFNQTQEAFDSLANAFGTNTQETIKALFSKRVVVVWDDIGFSLDNPFDLNIPSDMNWAVVCEIEESQVQSIQKQLNPTRRRIKDGQTISAIEQGRYHILLLSNLADKHTKADDPAYVILAPKKSDQLFQIVFQAYLDHQAEQSKSTFTTSTTTTINSTTTSTTHTTTKTTTKNACSILHSHDDLIADIPPSDSNWFAAWAIQLKNSSNDNPQALLGVLSLNGQSISTSFATDLEIDMPAGDAPVGLLSAVGDDAIMAVAMAQVPSLVVEDNSIQSIFQFGSSDDPKSSQATNDNTFAGPGVILLSQETVNPSAESPIALTLITDIKLDPKSNETVSIHADQIIHDLLSAFDPSQSTNYAGRFPSAIRTQLIASRQPQSGVSDAPASNAWIGDSAKLSWIASDLPNHPSLIAAVGPAQCNTAERVRWMAQAVENLDAIPDRVDCTGVLTSGYLHPNRATSLLGSDAGVDAVISKLIERIEWEILRTHAGIRGSAQIDIVKIGNLTNLGIAP